MIALEDNTGYDPGEDFLADFARKLEQDARMASRFAAYGISEDEAE